MFASKNAMHSVDGQRKLEPRVKKYRDNERSKGTSQNISLIPNFSKINHVMDIRQGYG